MRGFEGDARRPSMTTLLYVADEARGWRPSRRPASAVFLLHFFRVEISRFTVAGHSSHHSFLVRIMRGSTRSIGIQALRLSGISTKICDYSSIHMKWREGCAGNI